MDIDALHQRYVDSLRERCAASTVNAASVAYRRLRRMMPNLNVRDFDDPHLLSRLEAQLPATLRPNTARLFLLRVAAFGNWLCRQRYTNCRHRAPRMNRRPRWRDVPSDDEIALLLDALRARAEETYGARRQTRERDYLIVRILIETGARISEALAVRAEDVVRTPQPLLRIRGTKTDAAERAVPISAELAAELHAYRVRYHIARGALFRSRTRRPINGGEWAKWLRDYCAAIGIETRVTPHVFRHRYIQCEVLRGTSALELMTRIGHTDIEMTVHYYNQVRRMMPYAIDANLDAAIIHRRPRTKITLKGGKDD